MHWLRSIQTIIKFENILIKTTLNLYHTYSHDQFFVMVSQRTAMRFNICSTIALNYFLNLFAAFNSFAPWFSSSLKLKYSRGLGDQTRLHRR